MHRIETRRVREPSGHVVEQRWMIRSNGDRVFIKSTPVGPTHTVKEPNPELRGHLVTIGILSAMLVAILWPHMTSGLSQLAQEFIQGINHLKGTP